MSLITKDTCTDFPVVLFMYNDVLFQSEVELLYTIIIRAKRPDCACACAKRRWKSGRKPEQKRGGPIDLLPFVL